MSAADPRNASKYGAEQVTFTNFGIKKKDNFGHVLAEFSMNSLVKDPSLIVRRAPCWEHAGRAT